MIILYSIIPALCLCMGFYFGFILGKTNELPRIKNKKDRKTEKEQAEKEDKYISNLNKALGNLERYDGTSKGQEDIV